ncbi:hypothetical protein F4814DRAFT_100615 [Daldinia grandis]|nr:hypothetical protein F4814DRAFT_100615 [Daldinia grandis]
MQQLSELMPEGQFHWSGRSAGGERAQLFDENGHPKKARYIWPPASNTFGKSVWKYRRKRRVGDYNREEAEAIICFMRRMLAFQPEKRPSSNDVLKSEWMARWSFPNFERSPQA